MNLIKSGIVWHFEKTSRTLYFVTNRNQAATSFLNLDNRQLIKHNLYFTESDDVNIDEEDLYANAHKIPLRRNDSGDEEYASSIHEFCDEYFHYLL